MNERELVIGGVSVAPGESRSIDLEVARLYTDTPLPMPVRVIRGRRPGPTLFVSAAIHGDEINGVEVIRRLAHHPRVKRLAGSLILVPVVNVFGFVNRSRYLPDRRDLNRSFPGSDKGSLAARMADIFLEEIVRQSDYGIDVHTGAFQRNNLPQVRTALDDAECMRLARAFRPPLVLSSQLRDGSLREVSGELGVPVLLYEGGEALRFDETAIRTGLRGILSVMTELGMLKPRKGPKREVEPVIARTSQWVRAPEAGLLRDAAQLGEWVRRGQVVGSIGDPLGERTVPVEAPCDGVIIGATTTPLVNEGDALMHIAVPDRPGDAAERIQDLVASGADTDVYPPRNQLNDPVN